jgi:hypothetical protein
MLPNNLWQIVGSPTDTTQVTSNFATCNIDQAYFAFNFESLLKLVSFLLVQIFGGLLANLKQMGAWLNWIQYLSVVRYCLNVSVC